MALTLVYRPLGHGGMPHEWPNQATTRETAFPSLSTPRGPAPHVTTEGLHVLAAPAGVSPAHLMDAGATHADHTCRPRVMENRYSRHPDQQAVFTSGRKKRSAARW